MTPVYPHEIGFIGKRKFARSEARKAPEGWNEEAVFVAGEISGEVMNVTREWDKERGKSVVTVTVGDSDILTYGVTNLYMSFPNVGQFVTMKPDCRVIVHKGIKVKCRGYEWYERSGDAL